MEKIVYFFLPMALLFKLFVTKKETGFLLVMKYFGLCLVNNFLCAMAIKTYYPRVLEFDVTIDFFVKYIATAVGIGLLMAIIYRLFINFWVVKFEVEHEKGNKKA